MGFDLYPFLALYLTGAYLLIVQLLRKKRLYFHHKQFTNATIVLTGATGGIGGALEQLLQQYGARVLCLVPSDRELDNGVNDIPCDLRSATSIQKAAAVVRNRLNQMNQVRQGVVLLHAAGLLGGASEDVYNVNLTGPALLTNAIGDAAKHVVFLGSAAHIASPKLRPPLLTPPGSSGSDIGSAMHAVYPASKLLVHALAVHLANTAAYDGVHVIHPGIVSTTLYSAETGLIGRILRCFLRIVAWDAMTSATRVLHMLHSAGVFDNGIRAGTATAMYWDATTLKPSVLTSPLGKQLGTELESIHASFETRHTDCE